METPIGKSVYNFVELVGTSTKSWEEATSSAIETADRNLTNVRIVEVSRMDARLREGGIMEYRVRISLSFKHEVEPETL